MLAQSYPFYLGNRAQAPNTALEVRDKFTGEVATRVAQADSEIIGSAIAAAAAAAESMRRLPSY